MKSGLITLVGRSNVGKSTLLNTIIGTKISAVTDKPQTTRNVIHGVLNHALGQAVFVDTPGIFREHHNHLSSQLTESVHEALKQIDVVIYVADPTKPMGPEERSILSTVRKLTMPKIMVINKSDLSTKEKEFLDDYKALSEDFLATFELSAIKNRHIQPLIEKVFELLPDGEPYYPPDQLTNIDKNFWIAEIIREKIFLALRKEVPYSTHVEIESVDEKPDITVIKAMVYTYDKKYKEMIIGKGGRAIKEIGIAARKELEQAANKKVFLELEVETDKHWMERI
ncbi:MAG: GTPase Era [Patescibacteria group bacterium]|jgi:GTP-binding protein Era